MVLIADVNDRYKLYAGIFALVQIPTCFFLSAIIVPLYKVAKDRTALYILLSKVVKNSNQINYLFPQSCFNIVNQLSNCLYQNIWAFNNRNVGFLTDVYPPFSQCMSMIISIHVLALAVNRFVAVFLTFTYMRIFTKK